MRALVIDHSASNHLRLAHAPEPRPASNQAIVSVPAVSLNRGELMFGARNG
jgi:NADPH:quinone reductase